MWKNSQRYLEHCLYFDFPVCILLWLKKIGAKTFRFAFVPKIFCWKTSSGGEHLQNFTYIGGCSLRKILTKQDTIVCIYLSIYLCICLSIYVSMYIYVYLSLSVCLSVCLSIYLSIYLPTYLSIYVPTYLPIYVYIYISVYLLACLSVCLSVCLSIYIRIYRIYGSTALCRALVGFSVS
jgi:hypothetical protein